MPKLLIIDDDAPFSRVLQRAMSARSYDVRLAHSLSDTPEIATTFMPDFVLLDVNLSGQNGITLIPQIKTANPACHVVVFTSYGTVRSAAWAARQGASDYITKPADADELDHILKRCINRRTPLPENLATPEDAKEAHIVDFFERNDRRVSTTARMLGLHRRSLHRILERLGLQGNGAEFATRATTVGRAKRIMRLWTTVLAKKSAPARLGTRAGLRRSPLVHSRPVGKASAMEPTTIEGGKSS